MQLETPYKLVFAGPCDDRPETLRKLRGVFIAELNCSIEEVQSFFQNTPAVIRLNEDLEQLKKALEIIEKAGGVASIEGLPKDSVDDNSEDNTLEFSFTLDEIGGSESTKQKSEPKVYELDFDPEKPSALTIPEDLFAFAEEESAEEEEEEIRAENLATEENSLESKAEDNELELSLQELSNELSFVETAEEIVIDEKNDSVQAITSEEPSKTDQAELTTSDSNEFDLSLSLEAIQELPEQELKESLAFDLNIANQNADWDLALDKKNENLNTQSEPIEQEILPRQESEIAPVASSIFDFAVEEEAQEEIKTEEPDLSDEPELRSEIEVTEIVSNIETISTSTGQVYRKDEKIKEISEETYQSSSDSSHDTITPAIIALKVDKKDSKKQLLFAICGFLLILNVYLLWNNFLANPNSSKSGLTEESLDQMIKAAAKSAKLESIKAAELAKTQANQSALEVELVGQADTEQGTIEWSLVAKDNKIVSGNLSFVAIKPPALTKLEIGQGKEPSPWLYKVEINTLVFEDDGQDNMTAFGRARLFIETGDNRNRSLGYSKIVLAYEPKKDLLAGTLYISSKEKLAAVDNELNIKKSKLGTHQVSVKTEWVASGGKVIDDSKIKSDAAYNN